MALSFECVPEGLGRYRRPALFVGHPGHELKVLGWLTENRPRVYVLTDGSGLDGASRLPATSHLLERWGCPRGEVFGALSDSAIYSAILDHDLPAFLAIVDRLARSLVAHGIDFAAADAAEGFNPTHDICRQLINAAVVKARALTGRSIANYEFSLTEWDLNGVAHHDRQCWHLRLGDGLLGLKLEAAREYVELRHEVDQAIALKGEEYFRIECLREAIDPFTEQQPDYKPYYETWGEQRVAAGKYRAAIRYQAHMLPILRGIREYATRNQSRAGDAELEVKVMNAAS